MKHSRHILALLVALAGLTLCLPAVSSARDYLPHQVVINFNDRAAPEQRKQLRQELGVVAAEGLGGDDMVVYRTDKDVSVPEAVAKAEASGLVEFAEPDFIFEATKTPNDGNFEAQWGLHNFGQTIGGWEGIPGTDIGAPRAWDVTTGSDSTIIGVVDSGIDYDHSEFSGRIALHAPEMGDGKESNGIDDDDDGYVDNWRGWDFAEKDNDATDTHGHGTGMAGVAAAAGNDRQGITGVAWNARIVPVRVGVGSTFSNSAIVSGLYYAASHGARVVNMSFAGGYSDGVYSAITNLPNTLFVASAGNYSTSALYFPCALPARNLICTAAVNSRDELASFSNWGTPHVDLAAPGVFIIQPYLNDSHRFGDGTSPAAAFVSGAAALIRTAHPDWTAFEVAERIIETVEPVPALEGKVATGGRIDVGNALDFVAPQTVINGQPPNPTNDATPTFTFSSPDSDVTGFECQIDDAEWEPCSSGAPLPSLDDGEHVFRVRAIDGGKNVDETPASVSFTVDTVAPQTSIDSGPSAIQESSSANFTYSSNEDGVSFECNLDGAGWQSCPVSGRNYSGLDEGEHDFEVRGIDQAGNVDPSPATWEWVTNARAPVTSIQSKPPAVTNSNSASFAFNADEPSSFECNLDSKGWVGCASGVSYESLSDGQHTFSVRATDGVGTQELDPTSYQWLIDTVAPQTTIESGPPALGNETTASFTYSGNEDGVSFECRLDEGGYLPCPPSGVAYSQLSHGLHTFYVRAIDQAGNVDPSPATQSFEVDIVGPSVALTSTPSPNTTETTASFTYSSPEPDATFECSIDGAVFAQCPASGISYPVDVGSHSFHVRAVDALGNIGEPASFSFTVVVSQLPAPQVIPQANNPNAAGGAPKTILVKKAPRRSTKRKVVFQFKGGARYRYKLDRGRWKTTRSRRVVLRVKPGSHTLQVVAIAGDGRRAAPVKYRFITLRS